MSKKILFPPMLIAFRSFLAWSNPNQAAPQDSATFDPDGTASITRTIPRPATISPEAQEWLASLAQSAPLPEALAERRKRTDEWRVKQSAEARRLFPVSVEETTTAGVRTDIITPPSTPPANSNRRPESHGPQSPGHQYARPPSKRHRPFPPRPTPCRRQLPTSRLRRSPPRLLVPQLPETQEVLQLMAKFCNEKVGR
jgi:hypothetical protein